MARGSVLSHTRAKIKSAIAEIGRIKQSDFPQPASKDGLELIERVLNERIAALDEAQANSNVESDAVQTLCYEALSLLVSYIEHIGFFLRSANIRNAFELAGPLARLARQVVGSETTKVVLSSEWNYSPFTYPFVDELPDFVLIGLPASESGNGLVIALAGHEIGHAVWVTANLRPRFEALTEKTVLAILRRRFNDFRRLYPTISSTQLAGPRGQPAWRDLYRWAYSQAEETFCDMLGVRLFSESFLEAFSYILAPKLGPQVPGYPPLPRRVRNIVRAAKRFGVPVPKGYVERFMDDHDRIGKAPWLEFLLDVVDEAVERTVPVLLRTCYKIAQQRRIPKRNQKAIDVCVKALIQIVPPESPADFPTLVNAAWAVSQRNRLWVGQGNFAARRTEVLNELLLKSAEVLEISAKLREYRGS